MLWILVVLSAHKKGNFPVHNIFTFLLRVSIPKFWKGRKCNARVGLNVRCAVSRTNYATWQLFICEEMTNLNNGPQTFVCCKRKGFSFGGLERYGTIGPIPPRNVLDCSARPFNVLSGRNTFHLALLQGPNVHHCPKALGELEHTLVPWYKLVTPKSI